MAMVRALEGPSHLALAILITLHEKEKTKPSRQLFARVQNPHMIVHPRVEQQAQTKRKKDIIFNEVFALFMS